MERRITCAFASMRCPSMVFDVCHWHAKCWDCKEHASQKQTNLHIYGDITLGQMGRPKGFDREVTNNTARSGKS